MKSAIYHLHALSALHVGVGQAVGIVDLPIARERATKLPFVPGSGLKGVLRDGFGQEQDAAVLFGPETISGPDDAYAGALAIGDAKLLLLPVRSLAGVMAWVSCPFVLRRYADDLAIGNASAPRIPNVASGCVGIVKESLLRLQDNDVVIDDLDLRASDDADVAAWAAHFRSVLFAQDADAAKHFDLRFAVVSDDEFAFLAETGTEVRARIRIDDETGTVKRGALWYEENLPAEAVLWGMIGIGTSRLKTDRRDAGTLDSVFRALVGGGRTLQLGGKASVGRGLVRFLLQGA